MTDPPLCSPKNQVMPLKILRPLPHPINNDRSLSMYSYFSRLTVQVLGKTAEIIGYGIFTPSRKAEP